MASLRFIKKYYECLRIFTLLVMVYLISCHVGTSQNLDYRAQSLFIYKFTKHIEWPEIKESGDFKIGVYGNSPIMSELETMASLKKGGNDQLITIRKVSADDNISELHLLYIASSKSREIKSLSENIGDNPVLIVGEREGLARKGATINFLIMDNGILKFEVNISKLRRQKLEISEELLEIGFEI